MTRSDAQSIRENLKLLIARYTTAIAQIEAAVAELSSLLELDAHPSSRPNIQPLIDRPSFSVHWRGRSCFLGNTVLFRFVDRLARTPNVFISHVDLMMDIWPGEDRDQATIRGVVKRLRDRLTAANMADLAESIDGTVKGHYKLTLL